MMNMKYLRIIISAVLMLALFTSCSDNVKDTESTQSDGLLYNDTASLSSPIVKLSWWNNKEGFSAFPAYDGHGSEDQEEPAWIIESNSYKYILYEVPQSDYLNYLTKIKDSGLELYDYNFGLTDFSYIEDSAKNGHAVYMKDTFMLQLDYTVHTHELIFSIYTNQNVGE